MLWLSIPLLSQHDRDVVIVKVRVLGLDRMVVVLAVEVKALRGRATLDFLSELSNVSEGELIIAGEQSGDVAERTSNGLWPKLSSVVQRLGHVELEFVLEQLTQP
jgi:hypothetical protein